MFSGAGVRSLADVLVDPTSVGMINSTTYISSHGTKKATRLKEEACGVYFSTDLFFLFALKVFGVLHPMLYQFL